MNRTMTIVCCASVIIVSAVAAQRRVPGGSGAEKRTVGVTITLKAGNDAYQFNGQARCTHAPMAAIYGVVSEQWTVQQSEGSRSSQLTLWRPKNGSGEMFSLSVSAGTRQQRVNTVKAPGAPPPDGTGKITLTPAAKGGTFAVDARTADGTAITGTVVCDAFLPAIAEGGN
jgi:hypothetical protein